MSPSSLPKTRHRHVDAGLLSCRGLAPFATVRGCLLRVVPVKRFRPLSPKSRGMILVVDERSRLAASLSLCRCGCVFS